MYDAVAVNILALTVRVMAENKTAVNAEAVVSMALARLGCEDEFFTVVPAGFYVDGSRYNGND